MATAKEAAREILEHSPDHATWKEIMYELYIKQKLDAGLADIQARRTVPYDQFETELVGNGH